MDEDKNLKTAYIGQANPIINRQIPLDEKVKFTFPTPPPCIPKSTSILKEETSSDESLYPVDQAMTLFGMYSGALLLYKKYNNQQCFSRFSKKYYASVFSNVAQKPTPQSKVSVSGGELQFDSDDESMNLFAVFQIDEHEFDLILENDLNTGGFTQWFYFRVRNQRKNKNYRFNIVNLYKSSSLYGNGMKPLINSKKLKRGWRRGGKSVTYDQNQINIEHSKNTYATLSFQYRFPFDEDETTFAHCYPYTYTFDLRERLLSLEKSKRVKIKTIGLTNLNKEIHAVHYHQIDNNSNKKAIILMARQHSGETAGSFIMDEILVELTKSNPQIEFILWKFDIYCIPMVNVDGVILGNYRSNAYGFDLNRCWNRQWTQRIPQIQAIKTFIHRIHKKQPIELILDLHGHSRKMGSFFYGNSFGKNNGIFPYLASKINSNISFEDSTFNRERSDKVQAARVVLGHMIKHTGCFYTFETSFYGGWKANKKVHFQKQDYKDLGRALVSAMYKAFFQEHKDETTLKQSKLLKQVRKKLQVSYHQEGSQSDSEAEKMTKKQLKINDQLHSASINKAPIFKERLFSLKNNEKHKNSTELKKIKQKKYQFKNQFLKKQRKIMSFGNSNPSIEKYRFKTESDLVEKMKNKKQLYTGEKRKNFLMGKLRVFGETFVQEKQEERTQPQNKTLLPIKEKSNNKSFTMISQEKHPEKKQRFRTKSLMMKGNIPSKLKISQIFRVNRLENNHRHRESRSGGREDGMREMDE